MLYTLLQHIQQQSSFVLTDPTNQECNWTLLGSVSTKELCCWMCCGGEHFSDFWLIAEHLWYPYRAGLSILQAQFPPLWHSHVKWGAVWVLVGHFGPLSRPVSQVCGVWLAVCVCVYTVCLICQTCYYVLTNSSHKVQCGLWGDLAS